MGGRASLVSKLLEPPPVFFFIGLQLARPSRTDVPPGSHAIVADG